MSDAPPKPFPHLLFELAPPTLGEAIQCEVISCPLFPEHPFPNATPRLFDVSSLARSSSSCV
jgi:hypothetical protein